MAKKLVKKKSKKNEYSKTVTSVILSVFCFLATGFLVFVCYEMHRLGDLSPVGYIGLSLAGILTLTVKYYMRRAERKSVSDLEWEKTKQLTRFREKHPECFTQGEINNTFFDDTDGGV